MTDTLIYLRDDGYDIIEVTPEAEVEWTEMIDSGAKLSPFGESSYFFGTNIRANPAGTSSTRAAAQALLGDRRGAGQRLQGVQPGPLSTAAATDG